MGNKECRDCCRAHTQDPSTNYPVPVQEVTSQLPCELGAPGTVPQTASPRGGVDLVFYFHRDFAAADGQRARVSPACAISHGHGFKTTPLKPHPPGIVRV